MKVCSEFYTDKTTRQTGGTILHIAAANGLIGVLKLGLQCIPVNHIDKVNRLCDSLWQA